METRIARSGVLLREEWREAGELRAAIWRPDLGKVFLLSLDRRLYVETAIDSEPAVEPAAGDFLNEGPRYLSASQAPDSVDTRLLPDSSIDGHSCGGVELQSVYPDGHAELTRTYSATDLGGLPLRIETETLRTNSPRKILIERKNVETAVADAEFNVPSSFKKVTSL